VGIVRNHEKSLEAIGRQIGLTLHEQVRRHLRDLVETRFVDGERFFTERELIERLGVSQPTVRRALAELAAEGLLDRGVGKGTFVRKSVRERSVGIFVPNMDSLLNLSLIRSLAVLCAERDYGFHLYHMRPNRPMKDTCRALRRSPREERIMFASTSEDDTWDLYGELESRGYRSLYLTGFAGDYPGSHVQNDERGGVGLAFEHLMALGHRRIAFIVNEPVALPSVRTRLESIRNFIETEQLKESVILDCHLQVWDDSFDAAYKKMDEVMALSPRPTAICPLSAAGTWAVLRYLTKHRIRVPEEISLFSFDDIPLSTQIYPSLTSLSHSPEMEKKALDMLWSDDNKVQSAVIPSKLVVRESTGPARP
jgi:LacI family transcriptional regulator